MFRLWCLIPVLGFDVGLVALRMSEGSRGTHTVVLLESASAGLSAMIIAVVVVVDTCTGNTPVQWCHCHHLKSVWLFAVAALVALVALTASEVHPELHRLAADVLAFTAMLYLWGVSSFPAGSTWETVAVYAVLGLHAVDVIITVSPLPQANGCSTAYAALRVFLLIVSPLVNGSADKAFDVFARHTTVDSRAAFKYLCTGWMTVLRLGTTVAFGFESAPAAAAAGFEIFVRLVDEFSGEHLPCEQWAVVMLLSFQACLQCTIWVAVLTGAACWWYMPHYLANILIVHGMLSIPPRGITDWQHRSVTIMHVCTWVAHVAVQRWVQLPLHPYGPCIRAVGTAWSLLLVTAVNEARSQSRSLEAFADQRTWILPVQCEDTTGNDSAVDATHSART